MNCKFVENNLLEYIEKTLSVDTEAKFEAHLNECASCKHLLGEVQKTYKISEIESIQTPDLYEGITFKLINHQTAIVEFVPQHKILFRIAASFILLVGLSAGIFIGSKINTQTETYKQTQLSNESSDYYNIDSNPMDGETGLAILYPND